MKKISQKIVDNLPIILIFIGVIIGYTLAKVIESLLI